MRYRFSIWMIALMVGWAVSVAHAQRVTEDLTVLYTFQEGSGTEVTDVSGVGVPLDLTIVDPDRVTWLPEGGLSVDLATLISSSGPATKVIDAVTQTNEITVEAWIDPANLTQNGPARIVTISKNTTLRDVMLGQGVYGSTGDRIEARLRTSFTNNNGQPALSSPVGSLPDALSHVVYTRDALGVDRIYVNNVELVSGNVVGDFSNWDASHPLVLANEPTDNRPWLGELHLVAIYARALSPEEVTQNFETGPIVSPVANISIEKTPDTQTVLSGGDATFMITVENTGDVDLTDIVVTDLLAPDCDGFFSDLTAGSIETYTCVQFAVTENFINTVSVEGIDPISGSPVSAIDIAEVIVASPYIAITKLPGTQDVLIGGDATFTITVENTGNVDLTDVDVTDVLSPDCDRIFSDLTVGAMETYTCTFVGVTQSFTNEAAVTAASVGGSVSAGDTAVVTVTDVVSPSIVITKLPDTQDVLIGSDATFTITVENTGNVDLTDVDVTDVLSPDCDRIFSDLTVGATETYTCTFVGVTQSFTNEAAVTAGSIGGPVSAGDTADVTVMVSPPRVTEDLAVLYTFQEGSGTEVTDVSGVGVPLDLTIVDPDRVTWLPEGGLSVDLATLISSSGPATKVIDAVTQTNEITVEAWIDPANLTQNGPARIVTISKNTTLRDVMLGQGVYGSTGDRIEARLRTSFTNLNGQPALSSPVGSLPDALSHVVYTRDASGVARIYVNNVELVSGNVVGDFSNWDASHPLVLANEPTDNRPWLGELHLVAIYARALSPEEVTQNFETGPIVSPVANISIEKTPDTQTVLSGGDATFMITVENTGDVDLTDIVVTDLLAPDCDGFFSDLTAGSIETYTCVQFAVTENFINTVSVEGIDPISGSPVSAIDIAEVIVASPYIAITKLPGTQDVLIGGDATFTITVENTGNVDLTDVDVTDVLSPDCDRIFSDLTVGAMETYTCTFVGVTQSFTNEAAVTAASVGGSVSAGDTAVVTVTDVVSPSIVITKLPDTQDVLIGSDATFTITVENTGNVDLTDVDVTDVLSPDCDRIFSDLTVGATETYTCTFVGVTQSFTNEAAVTAGSIGGPVSAGDTADVTVMVSPPRVTEDLAVLYTFQEGSGTEVTDVSGVGVPLDLTIVDPDRVTWLPEGGLSVDLATLISSSGPATKVIDAVTQTNEITVEAWIDPANLTQNGPARIVTISKNTTLRDVMLGQGVYGSTGDRIEARLRTSFTNLNGQPALSSPVGSLPDALSHVVYTRDASGVARIYVNNVELVSGNVVGDFSNWDASHPLVLANEPTDNRPWLGELHLVAIYARALSPEEVTQNFETGPIVSPVANISIEKTPDTQTVLSGGDATFMITVENTGDVDLTDIVVTDLLAPDCDGFFSDLTAGSIETYTCVQFAVTENFINTVSVEGIDPISGSPVSAIDIAEVIVASPYIAITKLPGTQDVLIGGDATFTITVENTGNVDLTDVDVTDVLSPDCDRIFSDLTVGAMETYTCTFVGVTQSFTNEAAVTAASVGGSVSAGDTAVVTVTDVVSPSIVITKLPDTQDVLIGSDATFTITVENTGNVDLTDVDVTDVLSPDCDRIFSDLTVGATETYTCTFVGVTQSFTNEAAVTAGSIGGPVSAGDTADVTVMVSPPRVTEDLAVLYTFQEGSGTEVTDVSGVGVPLDLTIVDPDRVTWLPEGGLSVDLATLISSSGPATKVIDAVTQTNEITVEAWIDPANLTQNGPARIVTISKNTTLRDVMLGQGVYGSTGDRIEARLRTSVTNLNGQPALSSPVGSLPDALSHVVYTRDASGVARIYVNNVELVSGNVVGDFSNWDASHPLVLANEPTDNRPWLGELHLVAVYARALTQEEVTQNYQAHLMGGPTIDVWYGTSQTFGTLGLTQPWVNILGNVSDNNGVSSLSYMLNGGDPVALSIGPDNNRLVNAGDFNVDLATADLVDGSNTVVISSQDTLGNTSETTVTVNYTSGTVWPTSYDIEWSILTSDGDITTPDPEIQSVAQVVDGKWTLTGSGVRPIETGYDRVLAVGDVTWTNYEVTVPVTLHDKPSNGQVQILVRWNGHTDTPVVCPQPKCGYEPLGDIGMIRTNTDSIKLWYDGHKSRTWGLETEYMLKMRVETSGSNTTYSVKAWDPAVGSEPAGWDVTRTVLNSDTPSNGSFLLSAHLIDVTFGNVSVVPLDDTTAPEAPTDLTAIAGDSQVALDWADNIEGDLAGYNVYRGEASGVTPTTGTKLNASLLTGSDFTDTTAVNGTTYYYVVTAEDLSGNGSAASAEASATPEVDITAPSIPLGLTAVGGDSQVALDWVDNIEGDLAGYNVYRGEASGVTPTAGTKLNTSLLIGSDFTDTTAVNGTTYYYVVTAEDISGNESAASDEASATPEVDITAPSTPLGLTAVGGDSQVALDWVDNIEGDLAGYNVYRGEASGVTPTAGTKLNTSLLIGSDFTDTTAVNGTTYYYVVTAEDISGNESAASDEASATPSATIGPFLSDDFNQNNLDPKWTFVNPIGDGWITITDVGSDAHLELNVPGGPSHDPYNTNRSVRVMQPAADTDFDVVVKFDSIPSQPIQMQGLIVEQDAVNWFRFGNFYTSGNLYLFAAVTSSGNSQTKLGPVPISLSGSSIYLRVQRTGDLWTYFYSENSIDWTEAGSFTAAMTASQIGIYGANHPEGSSPKYTARADYFEIDSDPISSEDGSVLPDTLAPFIHTVSYSFDSDTLMVNWFTDEPADGAVEYGSDTSYGSTEAETGGPFYAHSVEITGLAPGETIHFRISSEDSGLRSAYSDDFEAVYNTGGPTIDVWYGTPQTFGTLGQTQPWVNILGNVSDNNGVSSLSYMFNGGDPVALSIGPDNNRLVNAGDFNVDLATADLVDGSNTVVISSQDTLGNTSETTVTVNYTSGTVWPTSYDIEWSILTSDGDITTPDPEIQSVAQVVDGKWTLTGSGVRPIETGYDRVLAVGDVTWTNYEVTVPVTLHDKPSNGQVQILVRWNGHTDTPVVCPQPKCGYEPLGDIGMIRTNTDSIKLWYDGHKSRTWGLETEYMLKMRVETSGSNTTYSVKAWDPAVGSEPAGWDVTRTVSNSATPSNGSFLLSAHLIDVTFGNVSVVPLLDTTAPSAPTGLTAVGGDSQAVLDWADNSEGDLAGYNVYRGEVSGVTPTTGTQLNASLLTGSDFTDTTAVNGTTYYYVVTAVDLSGNESAASAEASAIPST